MKTKPRREMKTVGIQASPSPKPAALTVAAPTGPTAPAQAQMPSVGRIVHYQRYGTPGGEHKAEPSPAVITQIHPDGDCQLFVMNPNGVYFNKTPYSETPKPGCWSWPPRV